MELAQVLFERLHSVSGPSLPDLQVVDVIDLALDHSWLSGSGGGGKEEAETQEEGESCTQLVPVF
jgi:hypothetical protein